MKKHVKWMTALVCCALMLGTAAFAAGVYSKTIKVDYLNIQLQVNGRSVTPRDVDGNVVDPFAYNGTTYLPIRAVSEALDKTVDWDQKTKTVIVKEKDASYTGTWRVTKISNEGVDLPIADLYFSLQLQNGGKGTMTVKSGESFGVSWKGENGALLVVDEYGHNNIEGTVAGNIMVVNHEGLVVTLVT